MVVLVKNIFKGILLPSFMVLYFVGLGLYDEKDVSIKGLEAIKWCDKVYLDNYTSQLSIPIEKLERLYEKNIILADRDMVENHAENTILLDAQTKEVAFLIVGDVFSATTHVDLWIRARELGIATRFVHSASIFSAIAITGLQLYKFGKTSSVPFPAKGFEPRSPYDVIKQNKEQGLHTLLLLDLDPKQNKWMTIKQAIDNLLSIEDKKGLGVFTKNTLVVGCARIGSDKAIIKVGQAGKISEQDFGEPLHCLIVPGKLHFIEEKALRFWEQV